MSNLNSYKALQTKIIHSIFYDVTQKPSGKCEQNDGLPCTEVASLLVLFNVQLINFFHEATFGEHYPPGAPFLCL